jgi:UDPglucose 6-dehydrogenase
MNEIANLCELVGADVDMVRRGIGADERIGKRFLFAGIGYGGSCFPKDVQALAKSAEENQYDFKILNSVMEVNEIQKTVLTDKVKKYYNGDLTGKHFALWGLAFKPETDDIREAPALYIIDALLAAGATVTAFDPEGMANVKAIVGDKIKFAENQYDALEGADALLIVTEWSLFRTPDFDKVEQLLKAKVIFDGRNLYDLDKMIDCGYYYNSIGRKEVR